MAGLCRRPAVLLCAAAGRAKRVVYTFTTHPWIFRDAADPEAPLVAGPTAAPVFYAPQPQQPLPGPPLYHWQLAQRPPPLQVAIRDAQRAPWSPAVHAHAPPAFRQAASALLLCAHRLRRQPGQQPRQRRGPLTRSRRAAQAAAQAESGCGLTDLPQARTAAHPVPALAGQGTCTHTCAAPAMAMLRHWQLSAHSGLPAALCTKPGLLHPPSSGIPWQYESCAPASPPCHALTGAATPLPPPPPPQDLLVLVLAFAAPSIVLLKKPPVPHGVVPGLLPAGAREHLFEAEGGGTGGGGGDGDGGGGAADP